MKIEDMLDIFDIDEIEKMSPEECKGLLKGFFIGAGFVEAFKESVDELIDKRYKEKNTPYYNPYAYFHKDYPDFKHIKLEFQTREEAIDVRDNLQELLATGANGYVTVQDLYSIAGLPTNLEMTHRVWYDLEDCKIERNGENYILRMPPAELKNPYRG